MSDEMKCTQCGALGSVRVRHPDAPNPMCKKCAYAWRPSEGDECVRLRARVRELEIEVSAIKAAKDAYRQICFERGERIEELEALLGRIQNDWHWSLDEGQMANAIPRALEADDD